MTSRRSNGEGSEIALGADGRWHASLSFGMKSGGARDRRHVSGRTRAEVAGKVRALQAKRDAGLVPTSAKAPTVGQWLDHWLTTIVVVKVRPRTYEDYQGRVAKWITPGIGHHRLDRLQPEHVERFHVDLAAAGLGAASVLKNHRILSRALKVAMQRGRVARNVCTLVDSPSVTRREIEPLRAC